ncbi:MAG: acyl-CoA dehydrogenase [Trueperaceae bacterium]|nr:MAG: acyl-CoA dehydrogenase [Trueperaceae bacterium]
MTVSTPAGPATTAAAALASRWAARADEADRAGTLPADDIVDLHASGYLRLPLPVDRGGLGAGLESVVQAQWNAAGGSAASALVAAMTLMLVGHARDVDAWADERERIFGLVERGALLNAVASEPALGSPSRGGLPATELRRDGGALTLHGHKTWGTGGEHLTHVLVLARDGERAVQVLVPNHAAGVRWERTWGDGLSLRASESHDVRFEGVAVAERDLLRLRPGPKVRNVWFTLLVAATYLGSAIAARDALVAYARERVPSALGHPIAVLPGFRRDLGELQVALHAARATLLAAARAWDERREEGDAEIAKLVCVDAANRVTEGALRLAGGAALGSDLSLGRHFRDARAGFGHPPSADAVYQRQGGALVEAAAVAQAGAAPASGVGRGGDDGADITS